MERDDSSERPPIASLVEAAATSRRAPRGSLAALVSGRSGEVVDRLLPAATEWLRRWRPQSMTAPAADCTCAAGRCGWCN